jgi:cyclopropane fatty-acyl-phospholipid synthase-like methyltransferase
MNRTLEPELMDDLEQARAYAEADFEEPNRLFVEEFTARFADWSGTGTILDLGCGPGDIVLRMAHAYPGCRVDGLDGSAAMLSFAEAALAGSGLENRVRFVQGESHYDAITSNSLLHHLHRPEVLWKAVRALGAPGAPVLVMDLMRPDTPEQAREIVETYAAEEAPVLKTDFFNSLLAAFEVGELRAQLDAAGLTTLGVEPVSDRHLIVAGRMPAR